MKKINLWGDIPPEDRGSLVMAALIACAIIYFTGSCLAFYLYGHIVF